MLTVIPVNCPHTTNSRLHTKSYWEYLFFDPESILKDLYPENQLFVQRIMEQVNKKAKVYQPGENSQLVTLVRLIMDECRVKKSFARDSIRGMLLSALISIARNDTGENQTMEKVQGGGYLPDFQRFGIYQQALYGAHYVKGAGGCLQFQ